MNKNYCAFFDVDGTLINTRSLISFVDFYRENIDYKKPEFEHYYRQLYIMFFNRVHRYKINRFYFSFLEGLAVEQIDSIARSWSESVLQSDDFFNSESIDTLKLHQDSGARIVFVTGSFLQLLKPLMSKLGVDEALCTRPQSIDGLFNGKITGQPCIAKGKLSAMQGFAAENNINLSVCFAYGDDETDLPMLNAVGYGNMVEACQKYREEYTKILLKGEKYKLQVEQTAYKSNIQCV